MMPKGEKRATLMRARSRRSASLKVFSSALRCFSLRMSMKSTTTTPPRSRRRIWRAISPAASLFTAKAVSSMPLPART
jgi:hypothetical protein